MRTIFETGWTPVRTHWSGSLTSLGQDYRPTLTYDERNLLVEQISAALDKVPPIDDLISYSGEYDRDLKKTLGTDASRFFALSNTIAPVFPRVNDVLFRMSYSEPAMWTVLTTEELASVKQWTTGVNEMYNIYLAHKDLPLVLAPGVPAPPGFTRTSEAPATQVVPAPSPTPAPAPTAPRPATIAPGAPSKKGFGTQELLIGCGVAVGLGVLIALLAS
jgi:hypothetical protein